MDLIFGTNHIDSLVRQLFGMLAQAFSHGSCSREFHHQDKFSLQIQIRGGPSDSMVIQRVHSDEVLTRGYTEG